MRSKHVVVSSATHSTVSDRSPELHHGKEQVLRLSLAAALSTKQMTGRDLVPLHPNFEGEHPSLFLRRNRDTCVNESYYVKLSETSSRKLVGKS
ncbi:hypothetical protein TNCV_3391301 [Trichonephila clavipes]|nr:hypothetical protein TNCV_3391301 [Trichonephila clavipes]